MSKHHGMGFGFNDLVARTLIDGDICQEKFGQNFGRILPENSAMPFNEKDLIRLADEMKEVADNDKNDLDVPVGFSIFGQFIDHDITLDVTTMLGHASGNVEQIENFRTPKLDLDSVYLNGPAVNPFLYADDREKMLIGTDENPRDEEAYINVAPEFDPKLFFAGSQDSMFAKMAITVAGEPAMVKSSNGTY